MDKKPRVVFTFVEAGMGHIVPATGISDAFEKKYGDVCEVVRSYIFKEDNQKELLEYQDVLINDTKKLAKSKIYAYFEHNLGEMIGSKLTLKFLDNHFKKVIPFIEQKLIDLKPDVLFASYYSPAHYALNLKQKGKLDCSVVTYIPDPILYSAWDRRADIFITNNSQAYNIAKKECANQVFQVPFVLRKEANEIKLSKQEMREKLGLPLDKFTILLSDGAYGQKKLKEYTEYLINLDKNITVISICGKNTELLEYFKTLKPNKNVTFLPLGFVTNMLEYNRASDLFVGKGGANALVESFYFGTPALVSAYANRLEYYISNFYITKCRCGELALNLKTFKKKINAILENPKILDEYVHNLQPLQDNSGAEKSADIIFEELTKKFPQLKQNN